METETPVVDPQAIASAVRSDSVTHYLTGIRNVLSSIVGDIEVQLKAINSPPVVDTNESNNANAS